MRFLLLTSLLLSISIVPVHAQLPTSLLDDFNRSDTTALGSTPTSPTSLQWSEAGEEVASGSSLNSSETIRIMNKTALLQSGGKDGQKWANVDMSNVSGYPTTLDDASGTVTWAFNMRQNQSDPAGFSSGEHGLMFVLASSSNDFPGSGNAYAVVVGQDASSDSLRLVSFNGGYSQEGDFAPVAIWPTDIGPDYLSVRVTFNSDTKNWTLYAEKGDSSYPKSDPRNVTTFRDSAKNSDLTGDAQKYIGPLWNHGQDDTAKSFFDDIYVTDPNGELPVELAFFDVTTNDSNVHLNWQTLSEQNNARFEIQHRVSSSAPSATGWTLIGEVEGAGTSTQPQDYRFTASSLEPGRHTFRLRQVDLDGTVHFSPKRSVVVEARQAGLLQTGANPVTAGQAAEFTLSADQEQPMTVTLVDALGRTVRTVHQGRVSSTPIPLSIDTQSLSSGAYFLRAEGRTLTTTEKFSVVR